MKSKKIKIILAVLSLLIIGGLLYFLVLKPNKVAVDIPVTPPVEPEKPKLKIIDETSKSRPFAIMINNISTARPYQSGLQDAYIIYEIIAEGGITRYLALFKDQSTERIGSIRSARHYYIDYVLENDAYYVHWGWSPQAISDISTLKINNINGLTYENKYFWRDKTLKISSEHTGCTSIEKLNTAVNDLKYRNETNKESLLNYSIEEIDFSSLDNVMPATKVNIKYSNSTVNSYIYNENNKYYERSVNNVKQLDYVTKEQYHFKNIITYQVKNTTIPGDTKGRQNLDNIGSGKGYYISNGYAIPIKWEKSSRESQTKYTLENGNELKVNDGNTFIQIQPVSQTLEIK